MLGSDDMLYIKAPDFQAMDVARQAWLVLGMSAGFVSSSQWYSVM